MSTGRIKRSHSKTVPGSVSNTAASVDVPEVSPRDKRSRTTASVSTQDEVPFGAIDPPTSTNMRTSKPSRTPRGTRTSALASGESSGRDADSHYANKDPFATLQDKTLQTGPRFGGNEVGNDEQQDVRDPQLALSQPGVSRLLDTEEIVRRQLVAVAKETIQGKRRLFDDYERNPYILRGLSQRVANPEYKSMERRARQLEQQADFIRRQRQEYDQLFYRYGVPGAHQALRDDEDIDIQRLQFFDSFKPPQAISLLKPSQEVARLNALWRTKLGSQLDLLYSRYATTGDANDPFNGTRYYSQPLIAYHVRPIIERRSAELKESTFEDMPLTEELIKEYFFAYLVAAFNRLSNPPPPSAVPATESMAEDEVAGDASSLGHAFRANDQENAVMLAYYSSALALHANRDFRMWYNDWKAQFTAADIALHKEVFTNLDAFVERLVRTADKRERLSSDDYFHAHRPLTWSAYQQKYRELVFLEIAQHRAENLASTQTIRQAFDVYFNSVVDDEPTPRQLLLNMPTDIYALAVEAYDDAKAAIAPGNVAVQKRLDDRYNKLESMLGEVWPPSTSRDQLYTAFVDYLTSSAAAPTFNESLLYNVVLGFDIESLVGEAYDQVSNDIGNNNNNNLTVAIVDARRQELDDIVANALLNARNESKWQHSPDEMAEKRGQPVVIRGRMMYDYWTPYDLSYPLNRDLTNDTLPDVIRQIAERWPLFDINASHEKADARRMAFDVLYANKRLTTELSQVEYLLKNVISETVERPLRVDRMVYDTNDLVLEVRLELTPQLASRIAYVPDSQRRNADATATIALEELTQKKFQVVWIRRSFATGLEEIIKVDTLDAQTKTARLPLFGSQGVASYRPEDALTLAGEYRAYVKEIDRGTGLAIEPVYDSVFTATIHILAECLRCRALFVPIIGNAAAQRHRECEWRPPAVGDDHYTQLEALKVLVSHGAIEYARYLVKQRNQQAKDIVLGVQEEAPWGSSAPSNLELWAQQPTETIHELFSFDNTVTRFAHRFVGFINNKSRNAAFIASDKQRLLTAGSDIAVLANVASLMHESGSSVLDDAVTENVASSANLDQTVYVNLVNMKRAATVRQRIHIGTDHEIGINIADFTQPLGSIPLKQLIAALRLPYIVQVQTARERRYFSKLSVDYAAFRDIYRVSIADEERIPVSPNTPGYSEVLTRRFDAKINAEVDAMGIDQVMGAIRIHNIKLHRTLFYDDVSETEFRYMIRNLRSYERVGERLKADTHVGFWFGIHSFITAQPSLAAVGAREMVGATVAGAPVQYPPKVELFQRGSEPQDRGYDYAGLYDKIVLAIAEYNITASSAQTLPPLVAAYNEVGRRVTMYNYFAFLAPALPKGVFLKEEDLDQRVKAGRFVGVHFVPTPVTNLK